MISWFRRVLPPLILVGAITSLVVIQTISRIESKSMVIPSIPAAAPTAAADYADDWADFSSEDAPGVILYEVTEPLGEDGHSTSDLASASEETSDQPGSETEVSLPRAPSPSVSTPTGAAVPAKSNLVIIGQLLSDRECMAGVVSILVLLSALYVTLSNHYASDSAKWAFGAIGTILGYWLGG